MYSTHSAEITIRLTARKDEHTERWQNGNAHITRVCVARLKSKLYGGINAGSSPALFTNFKLNQMNTKKINDIEVNDYIELSSTLRQTDIENAKQVLKSVGYFVDNLWQTCDVIMNYDCTEEQAQEVLNGAFNNDATYQQIWEAISYQAKGMNIKCRD